MLFAFSSTFLTSIWFLCNLVGFTTANQALADCELKCSQIWSFPAAVPPIHTENVLPAKPTSRHIPPSSSAPVYLTNGAFDSVPTLTTSETKPTSSSTRYALAVTSSNSKASRTSTSIEPITRPTTTAHPTSEPTPELPDGHASTSSIDINTYLAPHNAARAAHGAQPLTWSDELAEAAQRWASNCVFEHSGGSLGPFGENLAAGSGDYSAGSGVEAWVNEASQYNSANPVPSHFTQVVWKGTTQLGCAAASCNLANFDPQFWPVKFHVCEYSSPGNVIGQFSANVEA